MRSRTRTWTASTSSTPLFIRRLRLYWLDRDWQPGFEDSAVWPERVVARVRGYTLFGIPANETSVLAGGGSACRALSGRPTGGAIAARGPDLFDLGEAEPLDRPPTLPS